LVLGRRRRRWDGFVGASAPRGGLCEYKAAAAGS